MSAARRKLYLIDGYSNLFRAFYAIRNLSSSKGLPTNAVYGFVTMLRKLLRDEKAELVGVAMDVSGDTVRSEKYEEYKANRKPMPEDLRPQLPWVRKALAALKIPVLELERYEADDVLGTLARKAAGAGFDVVLVSADKDLMQLVGDHVFLLHTGRDRLYDAAAVAEDFGVPPERVADVLALMGDSVDNVPGVPGIGQKGALQLIDEFGSLDALLERAGEVKRKSYREGLQEHREQAMLSKELVTIHTDLPLDFDAASFELEEADATALRELYRELEFTSLLEELGTEGQEAVDPAEEAETAAQWREATADLESPIHLGLVGDGEHPIGLAVASREGVVYADFRRPGLREAATDSVWGWLERDDATVAGHDLKEVLRLAGVRAPVAAALSDSMLHSYLLRPALKHGFEEMALERLHYKAVSVKEAGWTKGAEPSLGQVSLRVFAAERAELPRRWGAALESDLGQQGLEEVYRTLEEPLLPVLVAMEERGIRVDTEFLASLSSELGERLTKLEEEIYALAGQSFNLGSPQQLGEVLFDRLGYPVIKKTRKTKSYSTDADTLQELANRGYEVAEKILEQRELSKLKSTYVDALPALVGADGRLHTRYQQAVAATGRLSSANPNLQNIPIRTEDGRRIRRAFTADEGQVLVVADYNQIELRVLAHIAEEPALIEAFEQGQDIHRATAAAVFGVSPELVSPEQRRAAKVINFGIMYGMSAFGLASNLGIDRKEAQAFIDAYLERYAGVKRYMEETLAAAEERGRVETLYGRVRWLPDLKSRNWNVRENARRMAINARIQGTAADLLKKAMIAVAARLREEHPEASLLLTVHDELVLEVPEADAGAVSDLVRAEMEGVESLRVPLVVDTGRGADWYTAKS
ncbi:MAG: DNA polymerase I [Thermoanaerobaculia bacterium]